MDHIRINFHGFLRKSKYFERVPQSEAFQLVQIRRRGRSLWNFKKEKEESENKLKIKKIEIVRLGKEKQRARLTLHCLRRNGRKVRGRREMCARIDNVYRGAGCLFWVSLGSIRCEFLIWFAIPFVVRCLALVALDEHTNIYLLYMCVCICIVSV